MHVALFGHIILISSQPVFAIYFLILPGDWRSNIYQLSSLWFDPTVSNPQSTTMETISLTITRPMRFNPMNVVVCTTIVLANCYILIFVVFRTRRARVWPWAVKKCIRSFLALRISLHLLRLLEYDKKGCNREINRTKLTFKRVIIKWLLTKWFNWVFSKKSKTGFVVTRSPKFNVHIVPAWYEWFIWSICFTKLP